MTFTEKKEAKKLQLEKDNQYLLKQIFKLAANKSEILKRIKAHPCKKQLKPHRKPIHIKRLVKVLGVNHRTILLLDSREFFHPQLIKCFLNHISATPMLIKRLISMLFN